MDPLQTDLTDFLAYMRAERDAAPLTVQHYRRTLTRALAFFRAQLPADPPPGPDRIDRRLIRAYLARLHDRGPATVHGFLAALRSFFRFLYRRGRVKTNVARALRGPKRKATLPRVLSVAEVERLIEAPDRSTAQGKRDRAWLETMYSYGL